MAYIVPGSVIKTPAGATGMAAQIAPWLTGDHTFIFVSSNATGVTTPSGYTIIGSYSRTTNIGGIWYAKKQTTDSSSGGSIALTIASGAATISTMNVRDVDANWLAGTLTSAVDYYTRGTTTALTFACNAADLVTGSDDCLLLVGGAWNASNGQARCSTNDLTSLTLESNSSSVGMFTGFRQLGAASSNSPAITAYKDITGNSQMCLVAVKNAAGGARETCSTYCSTWPSCWTTGERGRGGGAAAAASLHRGGRWRQLHEAEPASSEPAVCWHQRRGC